MSYKKEGSIKVTFQDGEEHTFTSVEQCAGLDPAITVLKADVDSELSETSVDPVQNKVITGALDDKADLEDGKVPSSQLPSYVDDVAEYPTKSDFPATGETGKIYVAMDTNLSYRWSGSDYIQINAQDNVLAFSDYASFPLTGEVNVIYIDKSTTLSYYWDNEYIQLGEDDAEMVTYQTTDPLTDAQVKKAKEGKLIVFYNGAYCYFDRNYDGTTIFFKGDVQSTTDGANVTKKSVHNAYEVNLNIATKMLSSTILSSTINDVTDHSDNFFASTDVPADNKIVRGQNLAKSQGMIAANYDPSSTYDVGDYCIYQNDLYQANIDISVAEAWTAAHWTKVDVAAAKQDKVTVATSSDIRSLFGLLSKGDIIHFDALGNGTQKRFRVIDVDGKKVKLLGLDDLSNSAYNTSFRTVAFDNGSSYQNYEDSDLDTYLNTTYYNSLSSAIKAAIVDETFVQSCYSRATGQSSSAAFNIKLLDNDDAYAYARTTQRTVGSRHIHAIELDEIKSYFNASTGDLIQGTAVNELFFEQTTAISKSVWCASADADRSYRAFYVSGIVGILNSDYYDYSYIVRPVFKIDLTNIQYTKED